MTDHTNTGIDKKHSFKHTLEHVTQRRKAPVSGLIFLIILYIIATVVVSVVAKSETILHIASFQIPIPLFAGVFSSLANICLILLVIFYRKGGFFISLALLMLQFPAIFSQFIHGSVSALPGMFSNLFTITALIMLHINNQRADRNQDRIRNQAITDRLTELPNRFACSELIATLIKREEPFAMVSIDLDSFKSVNDTMGFDAGNSVLIEIASRWKQLAESGQTGTLDFVTRLGGDEFALVIRNYHSNEEIQQTIRQYETALGNKVTIESCDLYINASFGYAVFPADAKTIDNVFSYSALAMNEVKRLNSSNRILHFTTDLLKAERTLEIERKLRKALENDTIFFNLQPQFDLEHKLRGFEVLARMKDESGSMISPGEFIPVAEKVGLVDKVDGAVFRKSAQFFGNLIKQTGTDITLSINISVRHLMKNDFLEEVRNTLLNTGVPAEQLEIEITESIMIDSVEKAFEVINEIKKMGVQIAIDDFGTGYSSLSYLNKFPANLLKIDKSFIDKMNSSDSSKQYVAAIISIGHIMGFDVISEGVEEPDQLETLRIIGCDFIQGFIWGRPLPQDEAEMLVRQSVS